MNIVLGVIELGGALLFGFGVMRRVFETTSSSITVKALGALLSLLIGISAISVLFIAFWFAGFSVLNASWFASLVLIVLGISLFAASGSKYLFPEAKCSFVATSWIKLLWVSVIGVTVIIAIILGVNTPDGGWDSWMIWNLRARLIFGVSAVVDAFPAQIVGTHPDYPLMLPGINSVIWSVLGAPSTISPLIVSILLGILCVGILVGSLAGICGWPKAMIAGIMLLCTPKFAFIMTSQEADLMVSVFYLSATIFTFLALEAPETNQKILFVMSGAILAAAVWTKNDGILFAMAMPISVFIVNKMPIKRRFLIAKWYFLGALPILILVIYFKLKIAPQNDLFMEPLSIKISRSMDLQRLGMVLLILLRRMCYFQMWGLFLIAAPFLWLYFGGKKSERSAAYPIWFSLKIALVGIVAVYMLTPHDLSWHITHSADRLFFQYWPTFLFLIFLSVPYQCDNAVANRYDRNFSLLRQK